MAATSSRRSSNGPVLRSLSSGRFHNSHFTSSSSSSSTNAFAYSTSGFSSRSSTFFHRSTSPKRFNLYGNNKPVQSTSAHSVRFVSPNTSRNLNNQNQVQVQVQVLRNQTVTRAKRTCMCSPTTHPGSFRCSLHKSFNPSQVANYSPNNRLDARRSAMKNSLVRIGGVEGDLVRRALTALIRPSSHQQRRCASFQPRPSRLCIMSKAEPFFFLSFAVWFDVCCSSMCRVLRLRIIKRRF